MSLDRDGQPIGARTNGHVVDKCHTQTLEEWGEKYIIEVEAAKGNFTTKKRLRQAI